MTSNLRRFLRLLCVADGRDLQQILSIVGGSKATLKRDLQTARALGVSVGYDSFERCYRVWNSGPVDLARLRAVLR